MITTLDSETQKLLDLPTSFNKKKRLKIKKISLLLDHGITNPSEEIHPYDIQCFFDIKEVMEGLANNYGFDIEYIDNHSTLLSNLYQNKPEFIINLVNYGFMRREKNNYFSAIFEMLDIPFMNASMTGIALTDDKNVLHQLATASGVPSPTQLTLSSADIMNRVSVPKSFPFPAFIKLRNGRGSCGISDYNLLQNINELYENFNLISENYLQHSDLGLNQWILQEYLPGPEYNVAVIGNEKRQIVMPILELSFKEIDRNNLFQTYQFKARILDVMKDPAIQSDLTKDLENKMNQYAKLLFKQLQCQDYCRMEFRLDKNGIPKIIDINPLTSYGKNESFATAARFYGLNYSDLWENLLLISLERNNLLI